MSKVSQRLSYWYTPHWNARNDDNHTVSDCTVCGKAHVTEIGNPPQPCEFCVPKVLALFRGE